MFEIIHLEDKPVTIEPEVAISKKYGLGTPVFRKPFQVADYLGGKRFKPSRVKGFSLDMHMNVRTLREVGLDDVETAGGEAVGLAFAENWLRRPDSPYANTPVTLLTGFDVRDEILERIERLNTNTAPMVLLHKGVDLEKYESFVRSALNKPVLDQPMVKVSRSAKREALKEALPVAARALTELGLSSPQVLTAFGFRPGRWGTLDIQQLMDLHPTVDLEDRVQLVFDIYARLKTIFGDNRVGMRAWLNADHGLSGHRTPLQILREGHLYELAHVAGILRQVTG